MTDIKYTKTGAGKSDSMVGYENGPLQKWLTQPTADGGYESRFDFGTDIYTTLVPKVVFGGWRVIPTTSNVYNMPRADRMTDEDITKKYTLTSPVELQGRSGKMDQVSLDRVLTIGKIYQEFELASTGADYIGFELKEAAEQLSRSYELATVNDLIKQGSDGQTLLVKDAQGKVDMYNTFLNIRKQLADQGSDYLNGVSVYVTSDIVNELMRDSHFISNGQSNIQSEEVRNGFRGRILGLSIIESGRLINMTLTTPANIIVVDNSQVIKLSLIVKYLGLERLPAPMLNCISLQALEYYKHYVVNTNGVWYINTNKVTE